MRNSGPNIGDPTSPDGFGRFSTACGQSLPTDGAPARSLPDKILKITAGGWYGHPNINRGECKYVDPLTDRDVATPPGAPDPSYVPELFTVPSSVDGIMEYTASHFGGNLRGELIASTFSNSGFRDVYRVRPSPPRLLSLDGDWSALSVAQGIYGELVLPKYSGDIFVLQPSYPLPARLDARVVTPFRGGAGGGLVVTVTGHKFGAAPAVTFNGVPCPVVAGSVTETSRGSVLKCRTPPSGGLVNLVNVVVTSGGLSSTITNGFMYMNV